MKRSTVALLVILAFSLLALTRVGSRASRGGSPAASEVQPAEDRSLSLDAYIEMGMPASDRPWSPENYASAVKILQALAQEDACKLPRYRSQSSGPLFARMCASENLDIAKNRSLPLMQRMGSLVAYQTATKELLLLYMSASQGGRVFDDELVEVFGLMLRICPLMTAETNAFLAALPPDDPKRDIRMAGLATMKKGMAMIVDGALISLTERNVYRAGARLRFAGYLEEILPTLLPELPQGTQKEVPVRLRKIIEEEDDEGVKAALKKLLDALKPLKEEKKPAAALEKPAG